MTSSEMPAAASFLISSLFTWAERARGSDARKVTARAIVFMGGSPIVNRTPYLLYACRGSMLPGFGGRIKRSGTPRSRGLPQGGPGRAQPLQGLLQVLHRAIHPRFDRPHRDIE